MHRSTPYVVGQNQDARGEETQNHHEALSRHSGIGAVAVGEEGQQRISCLSSSPTPLSTTPEEHGHKVHTGLGRQAQRVGDQQHKANLGAGQAHHEEGDDHARQKDGAARKRCHHLGQPVGHGAVNVVVVLVVEARIGDHQVVGLEDVDVGAEKGQPGNAAGQVIHAAANDPGLEVEEHGSDQEA